MPRGDKLSSYRTTISAGEPGETVVTYVSTPIVRFTRDSVTLDHGGWASVTTKRKMNQASRQFGLGYSVFQKDYAWYVVHGAGPAVPFERGMSFAR